MAYNTRSYRALAATLEQAATREACEDVLRMADRRIISALFAKAYNMARLTAYRELYNAALEKCRAYGPVYYTPR